MFRRSRFSRRSPVGSRGTGRIELELATRRKKRRAFMPTASTAYRPPARRARRGRRPRGLPMPGARAGVLAGLMVVIAAAYVVVALVRGTPAAAVLPAVRADAFPGAPTALVWPARGEAAVGVEGVGVLGAHGSTRPTPIASVAKIMTAYLVLRDHPLRKGRSGPLITVRSSDVAVYRADKAGGQSVVAVRAGERLTERQALEGLLLPSGNNLATLLARWDAGSQGAFVARMNALARKLALTHTRYADASGARSRTVSDAEDQVRLAMLALDVPAFRQIVAMPQVTLPVAGRQFNVDALLGKDGIVGIKTGSTTQAGGCFVFAAHKLVAGRSVTVVGAVFHLFATRAQPSILGAVFGASTKLLASAGRDVAKLNAVRRGQTLAWVSTPWGGRVPAVAARPASFLGWPGLSLHTTIDAPSPLGVPIKAGERIGTAYVSAGSQRTQVPLTAGRAVPGPSVSWRLTDP
jgi:serine-type D-Ala-D-Ala carboxypeptidase (penicillin-binding protein 5/6)